MKKLFFLSLLLFLFIGVSSCTQNECVDPVNEPIEEGLVVLSDSTAVATDSTATEESNVESEDQTNSDEETE